LPDGCDPRPRRRDRRGRSSLIPRTVVIVGAGLAGARCAETLRARGFDGRVILVGEERFPPYERPALSKRLLEPRRTPADVWLRPPESWRARDIELRLGERVAKIDPRARLALTEDGESLRWDALVLATGARARTLPGAAASRRVHLLRTLSDALSLRRALGTGRRLVIVGAGFVGTEVASTALGLGTDVILLDPAPVPFAGTLGLEVGEMLAARYRDHGIDLRVGARVMGVRPGRRGTVVSLTAGGELRADVTLVAAGVTPAAELFDKDMSGIPTDAAGRTRLPGVFACGDVSESYRPSLGRRLRVEHWTSAGRQGATVAAAIMNQELPADEPPYFWSDQFGLRLQCVGHPESSARVELDGSVDAFRARYVDRNGRLVAALLANRPRETAVLRRELAQAHSHAA
jgi:3-phenylpropionate/trans-cinnamate dioxygenase ferredoxin reductase component